MKVVYLLPMAAAAEMPLTMGWEEWKFSFGHFINGPEDVKRKAVYETNIAYIENENAKGHTHVLGVNKFAFLTQDEFLTMFTGGKGSVTSSDDTDMGMLQEGVRASAVDWTNVGNEPVVGPVKDQGSCGSCWAFSAVGVLESALALQGGTGNEVGYQSLSEQQLLDCEGEGCEGGWPYEALSYFRDNGVCSEASYGYLATWTPDSLDSCAVDKCDVVVPPGVVTGYSNVPRSLPALESALNRQPVSITVMVDTNFQLYRSGVYSHACAADEDINHAVIAVGYDADSFKVRNSWGPGWGEGGYIRIAKDVANPACILECSPVVPTLSPAVPGAFAAAVSV